MVYSILFYHITLHTIIRQSKIIRQRKNILLSPNSRRAGRPQGLSRQTRVFATFASHKAERLEEVGSLRLRLIA
jgi:hypothetical protein